MKGMKIMKIWKKDILEAPLHYLHIFMVQTSLSVT
jgi:hypothetical protein